MECGLLGRKLGHSYSPQIHACLGDYSYTLFEKEPEEVADFLKNGDFTADLNTYQLPIWMNCPRLLKSWGR